MTLLAAFQTLLYRYTGQEDIIVGTPIAGRNREETEGLIGLFLNSLAIRTNLEGNPTFRQLLHQVREVTLEAYSHQDLPFEKLVEELQPERSLSRHPVFDVMLNLNNTSQTTLQLPELTITPFQGLTEPESKFSMTLYVQEQGSQLNSAGSTSSRNRERRSSSRVWFPELRADCQLARHTIEWRRAAYSRSEATPAPTAAHACRSQSKALIVRWCAAPRR